MKLRTKKSFIGISILIVLFLVGLFFIYNKVLKNQPKSSQHSAFPSVIGTYASPIKLKDINKRVEEINFRNLNKHILLFILSQSCIPCDNNFIFWNRLTFQLKDKVRIIGIIINGEADESSFLDKAKMLNFPVYMPEKKEAFISTYGISTSSQTILIDEKGKIQYLKSGSLNRKDYILIKRLSTGTFN